MTTLDSWKPRRLTQRDGKTISIAPDTRYRSYRNDLYDWQNDFPLHLQSRKKTSKNTEITVEFRLDDNEIHEFSSSIGSNLNGTLPIKICYQKEEFKLSVAKPGRGGATLNRKSTRVAEFVSRKLKFDYIPAIRTAETAQEIVRDLVANELSVLEEDERYVEAMNVIDSLQDPILRDLSENITKTVSSFLPSVKSVEIIQGRHSRRLLRGSLKINVDDGVKTNMLQKGDGVQSLLALSLMRHASERGASKHKSIVAIEEPESHLHPRAVRDLRDVVFGLTDVSQIVVSSHSPLLVRWEGNTSSIIVESNLAIEAKKISDVRECLGVLVSDNLSSVEFVIFCEGPADKKIVEKIIEELGRDELRERIGARRIGVQALNGISKLKYQISSAEQNVLGFHVFADADGPARLAIDLAVKEKILKHSEYTLCICQGMPESELEDIFKINAYSQDIMEEFGVDISKMNKFKGKWSERIKAVFELNGKIFDNDVKSRVKNILTERVVSGSIRSKIIDQHISPIENLVKTLEIRALG